MTIKPSWIKYIINNKQKLIVIIIFLKEISNWKVNMYLERKSISGDCNFVTFFCFSLECYYHLRGSQNRGDRTAGLTIKKSGFKKLGIVTTSKVLRSNLSQCSLKPGESKYWDVFSSWQPLFINGRKETNFFFGRKLKAGISYVTLNVNLFCFVLNGVLQRCFRTLLRMKYGASLLSLKAPS